MGLGILIINLLCSKDSSDVNAQSTPLEESHHRILCSLQITITLTEGAWLIFFAILGLKIAGMGSWGVNPQL